MTWQKTTWHPCVDQTDIPWSRAAEELGYIYTHKTSPSRCCSVTDEHPFRYTRATLTQPDEWRREEDTCPIVALFQSHCLPQISYWIRWTLKSVFILCWPLQVSPPWGAKMSCRKRCKREIFKFAQYLFRLITGTLNTGKTLRGEFNPSVFTFAEILLNLLSFLLRLLHSIVKLLHLSNVFTE